MVVSLSIFTFFPEGGKIEQKLLNQLYKSYSWEAKQCFVQETLFTVKNPLNLSS